MFCACGFGAAEANALPFHASKLIQSNIEVNFYIFLFKYFY